MSNCWIHLVLSGVLLLSLSASPANSSVQDPSGRVAYLSDSDGNLSYSPSGVDDWTAVLRNRPLIRGDRLWSDRNGRAELHIGSSAVRLGPNTGIELLNLDDQSVQLQLTEGSLSLSVRRLYRGQSFEVATPQLAFVIERTGRYRIDVDEAGRYTTVLVWAGAGDAYGDDSSFPLRAGDAVSFYDSDLRDYERFELPRENAFDRYSRQRDERLSRSESLRYVDDDLAGYSRLDEYGDWRQVNSYGAVWFPSRVSAGWAPYRDGRWVWQEPWGWTWVDHAPWGFAPSHYGRWVSVSNRWGWIPGPRNVRPIYAPALVAFVGGRGWSLSVSLGNNAAPIGWFPLGPREVYMPSYAASRNYFTRVNVNNTVINNTVINNYYTSYSSGQQSYARSDYTNRSVQGAITAVPHSVFVNSRSVRQEVIRLDRNASTSGEINRLAAVAPNRRSVLGAAEHAPATPPRGRFNREVIARTQPPPAQRPFAEREQQLQRKPGLALEPETAPRGGADLARPQHNVRLIREQRGAVNTRSEPPTPREAAAPRKPLPGERSDDGVLEPDRPTVNRGRGQDRPTSAPPARDRQSAEAPLPADGRPDATRQRTVEAQAREDDARRQTGAEQQRAARRDAAEAQGREDNPQRRVQEQDPRRADREQQAAEREPVQQQSQRPRNADAARPPTPRSQVEPAPNARGERPRGQKPNPRTDRNSGKGKDDADGQIDSDEVSKDEDRRGRRGDDKKSS